MANQPLRPPGALWSVDDLAAFVGCDPRTIWRWVRQGRLDPPIAVAGSKRVKRWNPATIAKLLPGAVLTVLPPMAEPAAERLPPATPAAAMTNVAPAAPAAPAAPPVRPVASTIVPPDGICRHCHAAVVSRPRGLCWACYHLPGVRDLYPSVSKFAARGIANGNRNAPLPTTATDASPGTDIKVRVLIQRARQGEALFHPEDAKV